MRRTRSDHLDDHHGDDGDVDDHNGDDHDGDKEALQRPHITILI